MKMAGSIWATSLLAFVLPAGVTPVQAGHAQDHDFANRASAAVITPLVNAELTPAGKDIAPPWSQLLAQLADAPRENGSAGLFQAASDLAGHLRNAGVEVQRVPFTAHPYEVRLLGVFVFTACLFFLGFVVKTRFVAALVVSLLVPLVVILQIELLIPIFGGFGATRQENLVAYIPARHPHQRLIFTAHYDTKTDLFDHVVRTPIQVLGLPLCGLMVLGATMGLFAQRRRWHRNATRLLTGVAVAAGIYGVAFLLAYSGGAVVPARSRGALDDGAACSVLVRMATELAQEPPLEHTDVQFIFFSAEEVGAEGSAQYVKSRFSVHDPLSTYVINLDPVGASKHLAVSGTEARLLRSYRPDPQMIRALDSVHRELIGSALHVTSRGGLTDGVSFAALGIPTVTLISEVPPFVLPRGMHTASDRRSRIDVASLDQVQELLLRFVRNTDVHDMTF